MTAYPLADLTLARRLERCEGRSNAAFVEARARAVPELGATWIERAGAFAMYDGPGSPCTQTFALGIFERPTPNDLAAIEAFFTERGADVFHEISPLAGIETIDQLVARGYRPVELSTVLYQPIVAAPAAPPSAVRTRPAAPEERDRWAAIAAQGWSEFAEFAAMIHDLARVTAAAERSHAFFAEVDGHPIATGAVTIHDGVALLAGASTIPTARNQGAQRALLHTRLEFAAEQGADLAMMCTAPGSASQRNAERQGFRIAYTRTKWGR